MAAGPTKDHQNLYEFNAKLMGMYQDLLNQHTELHNTHNALVAKSPAFAGGGKKAAKGAAQSLGKANAASLGVIRLDYDYPPAPGDIDSPDSFAYDVYYRVVPGFTFEICQSGKMSPAVEREFIEAIQWLVNKGVAGITGDCGFMMYFQSLARNHCSKPVFMSSLAQLPAVTCGFARYELIGIMTANDASLRPMRDLIKDECGVDTEERRYVMVGCQDIDGFEQVALGGKVDVEKVTPGMVKKAHDTLRAHPKIRCFLMECTELGPYSDAIRAATRLPVYDAITGCDFFIAGRTDNERFGINNWQNAWDGEQAKYSYGQNLDAGDRAKLVNKMQDMPLGEPTGP